MFNTVRVIYGTVVSVIVAAALIVTITIIILCYSRKTTKISEQKIFYEVKLILFQKYF